MMKHDGHIPDFFEELEGDEMWARLSDLWRRCLSYDHTQRPTAQMMYDCLVALRDHLVGAEVGVGEEEEEEEETAVVGLEGGVEEEKGVGEG